MICATSESSGSTINDTICTLPRSIAARYCARSNATWRGLGGKKTNPPKLARASTAAFAASMLLMPQIFTRTDMPSLISEKLRHRKQKEVAAPGRKARLNSGGVGGNLVGIDAVVQAF